MKYKILLSIMVGILLIAGAFAIGEMMRSDATISLDREKAQIVTRDLKDINIYPTTCKDRTAIEESTDGKGKPINITKTYYDCMTAINYKDAYYRDLYFTLTAEEYNKDIAPARDKVIKEALDLYATQVLAQQEDKRKSPSDKLGGGSVIITEDRI
jgi:hypothetical protein